jgi:hypothetical protein
MAESMALALSGSLLPGGNGVRVRWSLSRKDGRSFLRGGGASVSMFLYSRFSFDYDLSALDKLQEGHRILGEPRAPNLVGQYGRMLKANLGEVAERLKAAVC